MNTCTDCLMTAAIASASPSLFLYGLAFIGITCVLILILSALDAALRAVFVDESERQNGDLE